MTWLIVLASIIAYLFVGALYSRSQVVASWKRAIERWQYESVARDGFIAVTIFRALLWPFFMPFDLILGGVATWMFAPVQNRKDQADQLRKDADAWYAKIHRGTLAERAMAEELWRLCKDRAKEVDL